MSLTQSKAPTLVCVKWLAEKIASGGTKFRLLDATWHMPTWKRYAKAEYEANHIPTALFLALDNCFDRSSSGPHTLPPLAQFEQHLRRLGVSNDTRVILYDNNADIGTFSVERAWWQFRVFGHKILSILDGGLPKWCAEGQTCTQDAMCVAPGNFKAKYQPHLVKTFDDVKENLTTKKYLLVDSRTEGCFNGTRPEPNSAIQSGHIPGSVSMPFMGMMDPVTKTVKSIETLQKWFADSGVDLNKPFITTCGSGVTACCLVISALLCGVDDVPVYDGSWTEWYFNADPSLKVNVPKD